MVLVASIALILCSISILEMGLFKNNRFSNYLKKHEWKETISKHINYEKHYEGDRTVKKSKSDSNNYEFLTLNNNITVLVISSANP